MGGDGSTAPDDTFLEMLMRCQGSRLEDQRSSLPGDMNSDTNPRPTVPDEDFFSLIMRLQSGRMEDQRATVPAQPHENRLRGAGKTASRKDKKKWLMFSAPSSVDF
jgi:hypothetical protein